MGYYAYVYTNDASAEGATVRVYSIDYGDFVADVPYDPDNSSGTQIYIDSGPVEFVLELDSGYDFSRWVYRIGSATADVQYDYDNPNFYYTDEVDIIIRPETVYSGGGDTVKVKIDFNTDEIYRIRLYYDDGSGDYVSTGSMYEPTTLYVAPNTTLELSQIRFQDGYSAPVQCTLPDGSTLEVMDENEEITNYPYVDKYGGTYYFYPGSGGGDAPDYGSFVERTVYINGLEYVPFISDGSYWYQYRAFIAE